MTKEMKRPTSDITQDSIKPSLSNAVELYTNKQREAHKCIQERDEYINYLESKLSSAKPQQAMPVVPECVAGVIESIPDNYSAFEAFDLIKSKVETLPPEENKDWLQVYNWLCEGIENHDIFALAFITGKYEIEKPQLFYLKNKMTNSYLCQYPSDKSFYHLVVGVEDGVSKLVTKFTQAEIDSMQTGSYELVPVEDGE